MENTLGIDFLGEFKFPEINSSCQKSLSQRRKQRQRGARTMKPKEGFSRSSEYIAERLKFLQQVMQRHHKIFRRHFDFVGVKLVFSSRGRKTFPECQRDSLAVNSRKDCLICRSSRLQCLRDQAEVMQGLRKARWTTCSSLAAKCRDCWSEGNFPKKKLLVFSLQDCQFSAFRLYSDYFIAT